MENLSFSLSLASCSFSVSTLTWWQARFILCRLVWSDHLAIQSSDISSPRFCYRCSSSCVAPSQLNSWDSTIQGKSRCSKEPNPSRLLVINASWNVSSDTSWKKVLHNCLDTEDKSIRIFRSILIYMVFHFFKLQGQLKEVICRAVLVSLIRHNMQINASQDFQ